MPTIAEQVMTLDPALLRRTLLRQAGYSQAQLAREIGEAESTVSRVLAGSYGDVTARGKTTRERVEAAIAEKCGLPVASMFPRTETRDEADKETGPSPTDAGAGPASTE